MGIRIEMQRRKVWLLFTAVIIAVFAMVGCLPEVTPDKTPPEITAQSATLSATQIDQGDPVTVTVSVTAKDKRSNLREAVMKLFLKKPGQTTFTQVGTETVAFASSKEDTRNHTFQVEGTNFQTGGDYTFKAEITASDSKGNVSSPKEVSPAGALHVQGASPSGPTIVVDYPPITPGTEDRYTVVPSVFNLRVVSSDADSDLVELNVRLVDANQQDLFNVTRTSSGTSSLTFVRNDIAPDLGGGLEATLTLHVIARDSEGNPASKDIVLLARKSNVAFIDSQWHVKDPWTLNINEPAIGNFSETAKPEDISSEATGNYTLPFAVTTLRFRIYPSHPLTSDSTVSLYIFTNKGDVFNRNEDYKRGEGQVKKENGNYYVDVEFANLNEDNAKWMAIYLEDFGTSSADTKYPWYVWKINSAAYSTAYTEITLQDFGTVEDFYEGKPINLKANLTAEILKSLNDLQIKFNGYQESRTLEELIGFVNNPGVGSELIDQARSELGWPADNSWRFAIRYHVKVTYDDFDESLYNEKKANMLEDPDTEVVYAISDPAIGTVGSHIWHRYDNNGEKISSSFNDILYYFGMPDSHTQSQHNKKLITDRATMSLNIYPEIVVVHRDEPNKVLFVADAALGAANRWIAEVEGNYKQYSISLTSSGKHSTVPSSDKDFPIFVDNTSPVIEIEYPTLTGTAKKYFGDRRPEELQTGNPFKLYDRIGVPMFYYDEIEIQSGQSFKFKASDEIALYDFGAIFTSDSTDQTYDNWRSNLPAILNLNDSVDIPLGYDFKYNLGNGVYNGTITSAPFAEDLPTDTFGATKSIFTDVYKGNGKFSIDDRFEVYDNFTWSGIRELSSLNSIDVDEENLYYQMVTETAYHEIRVPSVEDTYYVWLVARDRGAQDSWLFDYANDQVNIDPLDDTKKVYSQDVRKNQNNYFTVEPNLNSFTGGNYYENSDSEADAPIVVLLKVRAVSHSMNIQRLDIKEPCLVSYDDEWYAHSYNVLQLNNGEKVTEFDDFETPDLLPVDVYPVFKREDQDYDNGAKFGYSGNTTVNPLNKNGALETEYYGAYVGTPTGPSQESVPVVGGTGNTTFRVKTHDDIRKVMIELVTKKAWTVENYSSNEHTVVATKVIVKNENSTFEDGEGKGGYWTWEMNLQDLVGSNKEDYYTIVAKAYEPGDADFYEQWQWPIFVDTKGPQLDMFRLKEVEIENQASLSDAEIEEIRAQSDHLMVDSYIKPATMVCCPETVERWVAFQVTDGGGLMFEREKGYKDSELPNVESTRFDRRKDLCMDTNEASGVCSTYGGHKLVLKADDSYYDLFQDQNINNLNNLRLLGFPGTYPSPDGSGLVPSSLKYLERKVGQFENLASTNPWHLYYTNLVWGTYNGSNWQRDPVEVPTIAFFNNIDLLNGLWENNDDVTKKKLEFTLRDELGNSATWESWLRRKAIQEPSNVEIETDGACPDTTILATVSAQNPDPENIEKISLVEKVNGNIIAGSLTGKEATASISEPAIVATASFLASDFLAPAMQVQRTIQLVAETQNNTELAAELTINATYAGDPATVVLEPINNFLDVKQYLELNGMPELNALVRDDERFVYAGFNGNTPSEPVTVRVTANDDNVDRYKVTTNVSSTAPSMVPTGTLDFNAYATKVYSLQYDPSDADNYATETAVITFAADVDDCPEGRLLAADLDIFYQNPETFLVSVEASPNTPNSTGVAVELESDILWRNKQEIIDAFSFSANGVDLQITAVTGWGAALTEPGRGRKFLFTVNPFTPSSARAISGTFGSISATIDDIVGVRLGSVNNLSTSGGKVLPELVAPVNGFVSGNKQMSFQWTQAMNPGVYLDKYRLYVKPNNASVYTAYDAGNNLGITLNLGNNMGYSWYVVAEFVNGDKLQSVVRTFEILGDAPTAFNLLTPANNAEQVPPATPMDWEDSIDPDGGAMSYIVFYSNDAADVLNMDPNTTAAVTVFVNTSTYLKPGNWAEGLVYWWNIMAVDNEGVSTVSSNGPWNFRVNDSTPPVADDTEASVNYGTNTAKISFTATDTGYGFNDEDQQVVVAAEGNNTNAITCINNGGGTLDQQRTVSVTFADGSLTYDFPVDMTFTNVDGATVTATLTAKDIPQNEAIVSTKVFIDNVSPSITPRVANPTKLASGANGDFIFDLADGAAVSEATIVLDDPHGVFDLTGISTTTAMASVTLSATDVALTNNGTITVRATDTTGNVREYSVVIAVNTDNPSLVTVQFVRDDANADDYVKLWFDGRIDTTMFAATVTYETGSGTAAIYRDSSSSVLTELDAVNKIYSFNLGQNLFTPESTQATLSSYEFYSYEYQNKFTGSATGVVVDE
jgi:hypothetical protein